MNELASEPAARGGLRRFWPAIGPGILAVLLAIRALAAASLDLSIALPIVGVLTVAAVAAARRWRIAPLLMLFGPIAFVVSPARTELSFNLARPGETGWYALTLGVAVGVGLSLAGAVALLAHRWRPKLGLATLAPIALGASAAFVLLLGAIDPQPDLGSDLDEATLDRLPVVQLVNFAFGVPPVELVEGRLQARLVNDTDVPHTFSIDALDLDVYVPAGRHAVVDAAVPERATTLDVYCGVGDHRDLGMVAEMPVG